MKFNWGTGIFTFLALFLMAAAAFIIFAFRQDVNLVHKDYYQKGVDYNEQIDIDARSAIYAGKLENHMEENGLFLGLNDVNAIASDSGGVVIYRPSDSRLDLKMNMMPGKTSLTVPGNLLYTGRYIATLYWYTEGLRYEVVETIFVP